MSVSEAKINMKLLVDKSKNKVLFAEAGKECIDFIFHILSLPLGSVVGFLTKESMVGSIGSLYGSLENLSTDYLQDGLVKDCLLEPKAPVGSASNVPLLAIDHALDHEPSTKPLYICACSHKYSDYYNNVHPYVSATQGAICPQCKNPMNQTMTCVVPPAVKAKAEGSSISSIGGGYVKGVVTYMMMDDLSVEPMSTISGIALLTKFNVQDISCLEEKLVSLDMKMGVALLKASLMSKTVLTDVFLAKKVDIA